MQALSLSIEPIFDFCVCVDRIADEKKVYSQGGSDMNYYSTFQIMRNLSTDGNFGQFEYSLIFRSQKSLSQRRTLNRQAKKQRKSWAMQLYLCNSYHIISLKL